MPLQSTTAEESKSRLKQVLTDKIETAALRYEAAELEGMAKQAETAARDADGRKERPVEDERSHDTKQRLVDHVTTLLQAGSITPKQAGEILSSGMSYPNVNMGGGTSMEEVLSLVKFILENKPNGDLGRISEKLEKLEAKLEEKKKSGDGETVAFKPPNAAEQIKQTLDMFAAVRDAAEQMGYTRQSAGKSVEELKADHAHEERMEQLKADREHKEGMRNIAGSIPEKIGRGLARHIREGGDGTEEGATDDNGIESFPCSSCHQKVYVPHNAGSILWCGSCGAKYQRGEQAASPPADK